MADLPWLCKGMRYPIRKCPDCEYQPETIPPREGNPNPDD